MLKIFLLSTICLSFTAATLDDMRPVLYIIGDSTVKNGKGRGDGSLRGWGSRTFITEGHWEEVLSKLKAGDYAIMEFGHNDSGPLDDTARARGTIRGTDNYRKRARETAAMTGADLLDLNGIIADEYDQLGAEKVREFFPGDHTHTNEDGGKVSAEAVVKGIRELKESGLGKYLSVADMSMPRKKAVLAAMRRANAYFMNKWTDPGQEIITNKTRPSNIWTRGVYYEGLMALYAVDKKKKYYDYAVDWGNKHQWTPRSGVTGRNADDQCCGQTYIDLYKIDPRPERIAGIKACIDNMVSGDKCDDWNWIDAIQMAMPVFARLGVVYGDTAYFRKMYDLYHYTKMYHGGNGLYNAQEHLWWRDKDFVPPYKEPNGQNCYWSRGNGWVLAALVRVLSLLPADDPHRQEYLQDYLDMVKALLPLQRTDGFWNVSLRDPSHFGGKELSGTALFTYGIVWGIRQGVLDKQLFLPAVVKAWNAMVKDCVQENGFLGYVQGTGKQPSDGQPVGPEKVPDFEDYGLGCFLLAGSAVYGITGM
jgi:unsaturated rhamnogalacturonyl hydrolase